MSQKMPALFLMCYRNEQNMMKKVCQLEPFPNHRNAELMNTGSISVPAAQRMVLIRNMLIMKCRAIISFRGVRAEEQWMKTYRCFVKNVIMIREISRKLQIHLLFSCLKIFEICYIILVNKKKSHFLV